MTNSTNHAHHRYKNGQEIKPDGHFELKQATPKKAELVINKAKLEDGATYKVYGRVRSVISQSARRSCSATPLARPTRQPR